MMLGDDLGNGSTHGVHASNLIASEGKKKNVQRSKCEGVRRYAAENKKACLFSLLYEL